jgi:hypothetical protein
MSNKYAGLLVGAVAFAGLLSLGSEEQGDIYPTPASFMVDTAEPMAEIYVTPYGTPYSTPKPVQNCHPSYSGCLNPNASDYDCAGGSGNGPYYTGTVQVYGYDEFDLDRDGDGWGCE